MRRSFSREACDRCDKKYACEAGRLSLKPGASDAVWQPQSGAPFAVAPVGYPCEVAMPPCDLLGVSVIGTGGWSAASPSRFERLTH